MMHIRGWKTAKPVNPQMLWKIIAMRDARPAAAASASSSSPSGNKHDGRYR